MDNEIQQSIDDCIENVFNDWEKNSKDGFVVILKRAMHYHISPLLYNTFRNLAGENYVPQKKNYLHRFSTIKEVLNHLLLSFLWSVKCLICFPIYLNRDFIICSLNTQRKISRNYLNVLLRFAEERRSFVVNYGIFPSYYKIFHSSLIAVPTYFYRFIKIPVKKKSFYNDFWDSLKSSVKSKILFNENLEKQLANYLLMYLKLYVNFSKFLNMQRFRRRILFFIQDGEYTSTKVLFSYATKQANITSISLDHSVIIYSHLYKQTISDYCLVWGKYGEDRIKRLSDNEPHIRIIGRPLAEKEVIQKVKPSKYIIYFLPSFHEPMLESCYRSLEYSFSIIKEITAILEKKHPQLSLLVKPHPLDSKKLFGGLSLIQNQTQLAKALPYVALFVCEDSTITIEMLLHRQPLIYILDKSKKDRYGFAKFGLEQFIASKNEIEKAIEVNFKKEVAFEDKIRMYQYYFGQNKNYAEQMINSFMEICPGKEVK